MRWPTSAPIIVEHEDADSHYRLTFQSLRTNFLDAVFVDPLADRDGDDLAEQMEFLISIQDPSVQSAPVDGYDGLADPENRELFVEIDASGGDHAMPFNAKQAVASQFYYNAVSPRFDDGYLGGGQVLPYEETFTLDLVASSTYKGDESRFAPEREAYFRYGIFVDTIEGGFNGRADAEGMAGKNFVVSRTTMLGDFSAIVLRSGTP